jgi:RNA polymerase sigma-70 factor (ECF subfamily)
LIFREVEDRDLILEARKGPGARSVEAFNLLVSRWEKRVFHYILRLLRNREDALDVTQDVFLKAYQNLTKLDDPARWASWLFRIAHNESFSLLRKVRHEDNELAVEPATGEAASRLFPLELSLSVERALGRLSPDQREAVVLKIYQGFKFEEMAEILDTPVSTVKSRVYAGLDQLKNSLAPLNNTLSRGGAKA